MKSLTSWSKKERKKKVVQRDVKIRVKRALVHI